MHGVKFSTGPALLLPRSKIPLKKVGLYSRLKIAGDSSLNFKHGPACLYIHTQTTLKIMPRCVLPFLPRLPPLPLAPPPHPTPPHPTHTHAHSRTRAVFVLWRCPSGHAEGSAGAGKASPPAQPAFYFILSCAPFSFFFFFFFFFFLIGQTCNTDTHSLVVFFSPHTHTPFTTTTPPHPAHCCFFVSPGTQARQMERSA